MGIFLLLDMEDLFKVTKIRVFLQFFDPLYEPWCIRQSNIVEKILSYIFWYRWLRKMTISSCWFETETTWIFMNILDFARNDQNLTMLKPKKLGKEIATDFCKSPNIYFYLLTNFWFNKYEFLKRSRISDESQWRLVLRS